MALHSTHFSIEGQTGFYRGKVRDVYYRGDIIVAIATDRLSAFDVVLPKPIPEKGAILNGVAASFLQQTQHIVPNWLLAVPDPNVSIGRLASPFPVEMVVRGYLVGHAWREYKAGRRHICGVALPDGLYENDRLPQPIITPTTKAAEGHDLDISRDEILRQGLVAVADYHLMEQYALQLFAFGTDYAAKRGLILADTKYEFGKWRNQVILIDEANTPDSSRYFYADGFETRQQNGTQQRQLSKEFVRQWLLEQGFSGQEGVAPPQLANEFIEIITNRYIELYETILGQSYERREASGDINSRIEQNIAIFQFQTII